MFSASIRWLEISLFRFLSSGVSGFFLLFFLGRSELMCILSTPKYPVSLIIIVFLFRIVLDSLNNLKSCFLPFAKAVQIIFPVDLSVTTCVFTVCRFFLPEYQRFCFFLDVELGFLLHLLTLLRIPYRFRLISFCLAN